MYRQASKAKNQDLVNTLRSMESNDPEQFLQHLQSFCEECLVSFYDKGARENKMGLPVNHCP